jgi:hypothetical protein
MILVLTCFFSIQWAAVNGHCDVVRELMKDPRVNPAEKNNRAIHLAAFHGHYDVVEELLKDDRVASGYTALLFARR